MNNSYVTSFRIWDALLAVLAHVCVAIIMIYLAWWQSQDTPDKPVLKHIEINIISAKELEKMQHKQPAKLKKQAIKQHIAPKVHPKPKAKPLRHINPKLPPKAVIHPKPTIKKQAKKTKKLQEDPNFDPFAPAQSSSDVTPKRHAKKKPDIAMLMEQQLSQKEIEQYIHMMQRSVQQHWKVPGGIADKLPDPLVEMILKPNGRIVSIRILESSGDPTFDQTLIAAIYASEPFHIPQQQFESFRKNHLRFHPL
ncbi:MAG: TonB C-terminal domain-containing protein [Mariprofundaceae bacterium]|nr:TonB C-terminal domain-containing protein [Mariprofundaceae bacterium]